MYFYNSATMLIIYLPPVAQGQWDYVISSDGVNINHFSQASATRLPAGHGEVVAVLPWQMLSWHSVQFPPGTGSRKTAVLHSLLEESLLQDPQDNLLVTAPGSASVLRQGGSTLVAVCNKQWLRQALAPLQDAGLQIQRLLPEFTPVPAGGAAQLFLLNDNGRTGAVLCDAASVWLLPSPSVPALQAVGELQVLAEPSAVSHSERWSAQPPRILTTAQRLLLATQSGWDMAQDEWAQNRSLRGWRRLEQASRKLWFAPSWRSARRSLLALLLVQLIGLNVWAWQEESQWAQRQQTMVQLFRQSFPAVTTVIDPVQQMRRELQTLRQQAGQLNDSDLESMLLALAAHWPEGAAPEIVDYQRGELRLGGLSEISAQQLAGVPWSTHNYQWQVQGRIAVLRSGKTP